MKKSNSSDLPGINAVRRRPTLSRSTLASALVVAFAALATPSAPAWSAGLGRLSVQSHLGQALRAEVEVTSLTPQEAQTLAARLAGPEAFQAAGLQYNPALAGLRLSVETRAGRSFLRLASSQPLNEPFVDLLLELSWAGGKLLREYTFLLDPPPEASRGGRVAATEGAAAMATLPSAAQTAPTLGAAGTGSTAASAAPAASSAALGTASPATAAPGETASPPRANGAVGTVAGGNVPRPVAGRVEVAPGDTLGGIAQRVKPGDASLDQAMWSIFMANPAAFSGNMNVLRQGTVLAIPDATAMAALPPEEARRQVRMQTADFSAYRRQLAAAAPTVGTAAPAGSSASGSVSGRVVEGGAPPASSDRLQLSRPETGAGSGGEAIGRSSAASRVPAAATEQSVAQGAALKEAQSRLEALEKNVDDLKRLLELRGRAMADLQAQLEEARQALKTASGRVGEPSGARPELGTRAPAETAPAPGQVAAPGMAPAPGLASGAEATTAPAPDPSGASSPAGVSAAPAASAASSDAASSPDAKVKPGPAAQPKDIAAPNFLDDLLGNPMLFPALGAVAALGGGYALYAIRRRRRVERFEDSLIAADALAPNSLFGATGGQNVDTRQVSDALDGPASQVSATEVDPVEEANVYVAYGREAQAEDILREGLRKEPERQAIRHRLLELYAGRADRAAFESLAREMQTLTGGQGEDWVRVAQLGLSIDPDNPLYGGDGSPKPVAAPLAPLAAVAAAVPAMSVVPSPAPSMAPPLAFDTPGSDGIEITAPPETETSVALEPQSLSASTLPALDLALDAPTGFADTSLDSSLNPLSASDAARNASREAATDAAQGGAQGGSSDDLRARVPNLPDALDLDLDLAALEEISRIQVPTLLPRTAPSPADLGLDLDLENALNAPTDIAFGPTETETSRWQEMATKLDLAVAYREIGDDEGARELLQEVISGGDPEQQDKARALLAQLA
jgi:pilus assembly protein FimV